MIAATYDIFASDLNSHLSETIIELKSSKAVQKSHKMQAAFQAKNKGVKNAWVVCLGAQNKKGYSLHKVNVEKEYADFVKICNGESLLK